jgi:broad specificity phosphatase PhoE
VLILVRHGRTGPNADGRLLGRADPPLDEVGREQAATLGEAVGPVDRVVSSPLRRARETAAGFGCPVEVDDRWIELDYGELDQAPASSVPAAVWATWRADIAFTPPGGESLVALGVRVRAALEDLAEPGSRERVVIVTHVSPLKAAVAWALGVGDEVAWRLWVATASITRVAIGDRGPLLQSFNDTSHLTP